MTEQSKDPASILTLTIPASSHDGRWKVKETVSVDIFFLAFIYIGC
jgi:hypothetical protein